MSEQEEAQATTLQRLANDDKEAWKAYWKQQSQPWRTEPEIDTKRQQYLSERKSFEPDIEQGIYPFQNIKLSRADVEWLLATHEDADGNGPIDWRDESQRERMGLELYGADLRKADLSGLPLARIYGTLPDLAVQEASSIQREAATIHLEGASLVGAHLEGAFLSYAHLEGANLVGAHLEGAFLIYAHLERVSLSVAQLKGAFLGIAHLEGADLSNAHLESADLREAHLEGADLHGAFLDSTTQLNGILLGNKQFGAVSLADVHWGGVNLAVVDWKSVKVLGDEQIAVQLKDFQGKEKEQSTRIDEYHAAVRANRQLAIVLRDQGLNEEADHFAYRAQLLQRKVLWRQRKFGRWLFSMLLTLLSGYGYRIWRILAAYVVVVSLFALAYFVLGLYYPPHLPLVQAFLESIMAFHGRVFLEQFSPTTPQIWFTAFEAIAGLVIEGVFIAMLIQRFFGK